MIASNKLFLPNCSVQNYHFKTKQAIRRDWSCSPSGSGRQSALCFFFFFNICNRREQSAVYEPPARHFLQSQSNDVGVTKIDIRSSSAKLSRKWLMSLCLVTGSDGVQIIRSCRVLIKFKSISTATQDSWYFLTVEFHWVFLEDKKIHDWSMRGVGNICHRVFANIKNLFKAR